ncbi:hypothetical protein SJ345_13900 [Citrobacter braakii]|uniref:hypothetical protein n=1 Tax=Citrobacter braakii TaxID=57706 RepID=UPI0029D6DEA2|nr:hypothetical protein [Citrobacter braakii]MDX7347668.1 hypothetical protein [Citrobacter braakii]
MSTITKELAKLFRKITNSEIDAEGNAHVVLFPADSLLINNARIALASLEAEAVAYMHHSGQVVTREECCDDKIFAICCKVETPLYAAPQLPQPAVVNADDNFYSWFGREWHENYQHNQYTSAAKQMLGVMAESAWMAGRRAAILKHSAPFIVTSDHRMMEMPKDEDIDTVAAMQAGNHTEQHLNMVDNSGDDNEKANCRLPFAQWLSQQNDPIDVDCGCVTTEAFYHWLRVAYEAGNSPVTPDCSCRTCRPVTFTDSRFVVCPECGNKRCPHANDHRNACTGSNAPGQEGSAYPAAPQQEAE